MCFWHHIGALSKFEPVCIAMKCRRGLLQWYVAFFNFFNYLEWMLRGFRSSMNCDNENNCWFSLECSNVIHWQLVVSLRWDLPWNIILVNSLSASMSNLIYALLAPNLTKFTLFPVDHSTAECHTNSASFSIKQQLLRGRALFKIYVNICAQFYFPYPWD